MSKTETAILTPATSLKPATDQNVAVAEAPKRALDKSSLTGAMDNNGALMGVSGAKYVENKPAVSYDEHGIPLKLDANGNPQAKFDANGHPVLREGIGSGKSGAGDSYKAMSQKLENERKLQAMAEAKRQAELMKTQIVEQIRSGSSDPYLQVQLAQINKQILNLPADHTGY